MVFYYFSWLFIIQWSPPGGSTAAPLVLADLLQQSLFWQVSDKFSSSSWRSWCAAMLRCIFGKCMLWTHILQVHVWNAYLTIAWLQSLFGKCIVGKLMPDAVAVPGAQIDTKNIQTSLPKYRFWKPECFQKASWSRIFYTRRFWSQNGTTIQLLRNYF